MHTAKLLFWKSLEKVCLNIDLISFDQRYYIKSYCISNVWSLHLLHYLSLYRSSNVPELQCSILVKRKTIPAHGGLHLRNVRKRVALHIYQEKSQVEANCFHRIL